MEFSYKTDCSFPAENRFLLEEQLARFSTLSAAFRVDVLHKRALARGGHMRRNNCGGNYFTCDSARAAIIFKRLRWRLRHNYFSNFERKRKSNMVMNDCFSIKCDWN